MKYDTVIPQVVEGIFTVFRYCRTTEIFYEIKYEQKINNQGLRLPKIMIKKIKTSRNNDQKSNLILPKSDG